jgi:RNA polymerase sigma factor for flagellar operon FliA
MMKALENPWARTKNRAPLNPKVKEQLIKTYAPLIKYIAQRMLRKLPRHIELEDLINSGVLGLMDAIEKFDPTRDIKFKTYAEIRIRGAILDGLRAQDWAPRSLRQKASKIASTYAQVEQKLGRPATIENIAEEMNMDVKKVEDILTQLEKIPLISLEEIAPNFAETVPDNFGQQLLGYNDGDPLFLLNLKELTKAIGEAIDELPYKEKMVITLYYHEELTMKEIGKILGLTQSRVSQLHTQAILRLKGKLKRLLE